jgi:tripartite-type tricarboxylate transporter receptor subunit TctC
MSRHRIVALVAVLIVMGCTVSPVRAFPDHAIKLVVPVPPGGSTDAVARLLALRLQAILGQPVVTENQPGAGGVIAAKAIGPSAKNAEFNPLTAFTPVATVSTENMVLVVNPKVPANTLGAFLAYAKANPGRLNYGSAPGIAPHFVSELFKLQSGTDIVHIPYKGAGPVITDLLAGQIDMAFNNKSVLLPLIRDGRLRALAVTSAARWPELPNVPTLIEAGIFTFPIEVWWGVVGPAGVPKSIVDTLNGAINQALGSAELRASFSNLGIEPRPGTPQQFAMLLADDAPRWFDIVRLTGIRVE